MTKDYLEVFRSLTEEQACERTFVDAHPAALCFTTDTNRLVFGGKACFADRSVYYCEIDGLAEHCSLAAIKRNCGTYRVVDHDNNFSASLIQYLVNHGRKVVQIYVHYQEEGAVYEVRTCSVNEDNFGGVFGPWQLVNRTIENMAIDSHLDETSANAVQNAAVTKEIRDFEQSVEDEMGEGLAAIADAIYNSRKQTEEAKKAADTAKASGEQAMSTAKQALEKAAEAGMAAYDANQAASSANAASRAALSARDSAIMAYNSAREAALVAFENANSAATARDNALEAAAEAKAATEANKAVAEQMTAKAEQAAVDAAEAKKAAQSAIEAEIHEAERVEAESRREAAEEQRLANEVHREDNETEREKAEAKREEAEAIRYTQEDIRQSNEFARKEAESERNLAEYRRKQNETYRQEREAVRDKSVADFVGQVNEAVLKAESAAASAQTAVLSAQTAVSEAQSAVEDAREAGQAAESIRASYEEEKIERARDFNDFLRERANVTYKAVSALPLITDAEEGVIYLLPVADVNDEGDLFDEFVVVNAKWERFGTGRIDISGLATKEELDSYAKKEELNNYAPTATIGALANLVTNNKTSIVAAINEAAQSGGIKTINGSAPDSSGNIDVPVITDEEKAKLTELDLKVNEVDDYYSTVSRRGTMEVWHAIIDYTKKFEVRATGSTIVARFSVNPYNPKPQHQFIVPSYEVTDGVKVRMKICSDAACTNVIAEEGEMVEFAAGTFVYVKYDLYYNSSVLGMKVKFAAKDGYGDYVGEKIETLAPVTLFCESDYITPMSGNIKVHCLGGMLTAAGKKFGSDYRYLSKLTMDGVSPSGGGDISRVSVGKDFVIHVNASADNLGDTINIRVENAAIDVLVSNDTSPEYVDGGDYYTKAEVDQKLGDMSQLETDAKDSVLAAINELVARVKALEEGGGGVKASYDEAANSIVFTGGAAYNGDDSSLSLNGGTYDENDKSINL